MLTWIKAGLRGVLDGVERLFDAAFSPRHNPFNYLGALTVFFFWVVLVSGIYVFIFFETSIFGAYASVERLTHDQWYAGGIMRSLHRYASDAAIITILLHMLREFAKDRYRGPRWFSWFTGMPLLWMVFPLGITGYWLVWDELAQYIAIASAELMDVLPIFTDPMARNFLTPASLSDRFFTLLAFLHLIGIPIFLVFGIWFHLLRISRPKVNPPRALMTGSLGAMLVLSIVHPALSQPPADLNKVPTVLGFDWFYLPAYPLIDITTPQMVWLLLVGTSLVISLLPWLPPLRRAAPARVTLDQCNGCGRCVEDCPFNAVTMLPRTDGTRYEKEAVVDPDLCTACGICVGACPTATPHRRKSELVPGIELPDSAIAALRAATLAESAKLSGEARVMVYGCECNTHLARLRGSQVGVVTMPCIAMLPPSFVDFVIARRHAEGVLLTGCRDGDCQYRFGIDWTEQRILGQRDPYLRQRVPRERIDRQWTGDRDLAPALAAFQSRVQALGPLAHDDGPGATPAPTSTPQEQVHG